VKNQNWSWIDYPIHRHDEFWSDRNTYRNQQRSRIKHRDIFKHNPLLAKEKFHASFGESHLIARKRRWWFNQQENSTNIRTNAFYFILSAHQEDFYSDDDSLLSFGQHDGRQNKIMQMGLSYFLGGSGKSEWSPQKPSFTCYNQVITRIDKILWPLTKHAFAFQINMSRSGSLIPMTPHKSYHISSVAINQS
jgi:hypothetical protein